jgi:hypothetical protein
MNNIVGISGRVGSGKDTVAKMIQYYIADQKERYSDCLDYYPSINEYLNGVDVYNVNYVKNYEESISQDSGWRVKKYAGKLKTIASILTGIPVGKFEDHEFKNSELPKEWQIEPLKGGYSVDLRLLDEGNEKEEIAKIQSEYRDTGVITHPAAKRIEGIKGMTTWRHFLQALGTEGLRNGLHQNVWLNALWCDYKEGYKWIITDTRFHNELQSVKDRGGITLRLTRNSNVPATHPSETELDNAEFDYVIDNENQSLEETYEEVKKFCIHYDLH